MEDKEKELNKTVMDVILKAGEMVSEKHTPFFFPHILPNETTPINITINRKSIDKEIIRSVKELALFHEVLDMDSFKLRLAEIIGNVISILETGEEVKE